MDCLFFYYFLVGSDSERKKKRNILFFISYSSLRTLDSGVINPSTLFWSTLSLHQLQIDINQEAFFYFVFTFSFAKSEWPWEVSNHLFLILNNGGIVLSGFACSFETNLCEGGGVALSDQWVQVVIAGQWVTCFLSKASQFGFISASLVLPLMLPCKKVLLKTTEAY